MGKIKRPPTKHELEILSRQLVDCRCGICGELLASDVSVRESVKLMKAHRRDAHPDFVPVSKPVTPQKKNSSSGISREERNRQRREVADQKVMRALSGGQSRTIKELSVATGIGTAALTKRMGRLAAEGKVWRGEQRIVGRAGGVISIYRRAA